ITARGRPPLPRPVVPPRTGTARRGLCPHRRGRPPPGSPQRPTRSATGGPRRALRPERPPHPPGQGRRGVMPKPPVLKRGPQRAQGCQLGRAIRTGGEVLLEVLAVGRVEFAIEIGGEQVVHRG